MKILTRVTTFALLVPALVAAQTPPRSDILQRGGDPRGGEDANRLELLTGETVFGQNFWHDDASGAYQCGGGVGVQWARLGDWTPEVRINADDGWGGCRQTFALLDPANKLADLTMKITFTPGPNSDAGQCGDPGEREIFRTATQPAWSRVYRIDTDSRPGGCNWTLSVHGRRDVEVRVRFFPDDEGIEQCGNPTRSDRTPGAPEYHTAKEGSPVTLGFNTDGRWGGCRFSLQLRKTTAG